MWIRAKYKKGKKFFLKKKVKSSRIGNYSFFLSPNLVTNEMWFDNENH